MCRVSLHGAWTLFAKSALWNVRFYNLLYVSTTCYILIPADTDMSKR